MKVRIIYTKKELNRLKKLGRTGSSLTETTRNIEKELERELRDIFIQEFDLNLGVDFFIESESEFNKQAEKARMEKGWLGMKPPHW